MLQLTHLHLALHHDGCGWCHAKSRKNKVAKVYVVNLYITGLGIAENRTIYLIMIQFKCFHIILNFIYMLSFWFLLNQCKGHYSNALIHWFYWSLLVWSVWDREWNYAVVKLQLSVFHVASVKLFEVMWRYALMSVFLMLCCGNVHVALLWASHVFSALCSRKGCSVFGLCTHVFSSPFL